MGATTAPFIEHRNPYLPRGWDAGWLAALRAGGTTPVRLLAIGDSITQGQYADFSGSPPANYDYRADGWHHKLVALLLAKHGLVEGAELFSPLTDSKVSVPNYVSAAYVGGGTTGARPFVVPGTTGEVAGGAYATRSVDSNGWWRQVRFSQTGAWATADDAVLQFNAPAGTVRCDVLTAPFAAASGATWKYNWGGPVATGDTTVTTSYTTPSPLTRAAGTKGEPVATTVYSGVASQGPLYLGNQSASGALCLNGILAYYDTAKGLQHGRLAYGGRTLAEFCQFVSTLFPNDKVEGLFGTTDGYAGFPRTPHLTILAPGTNDNNRNVAGLSYGPAGYRAALERVVQAIRFSNATASVLIVLPWHSGDFDDQANSVNNSSWGGFQAAARSVAERWQCAYVDFTALWDPTPVASGYISGDAHPTRAGYTAMAAELVTIL